MGEAALSLENSVFDHSALPQRGAITAEQWALLAQKVQSPLAHLVPVQEQLRSLFPGGGLRRGSTVTVVGSTSIALSLVAEATESGLWCAAVGLPELGAVAASDIGIDLSRFPMVPDLGKDWSSTLAALVDGFDIILMRTTKSLSPAMTRRLQARMRQKGTVLVLVATVPNAWAAADAIVRQVGARVDGLGLGHGYITNRSFDVLVDGRGSSARPLKAQIRVA